VAPGPFIGNVLSRASYNHAGPKAQFAPHPWAWAASIHIYPRPDPAGETAVVSKSGLITVHVVAFVTTAKCSSS
jgi:hypothetical protein